MDVNENYSLMLRDVESCLCELKRRHDEVKTGIPPRIANLPLSLQAEITRMLADLLTCQNRLVIIFVEIIKALGQERDTEAKKADEFFRQRNELFMMTGELIDICEKGGLGHNIGHIRSKLRHDLAEGLLLEDFQEFLRNKHDKESGV